jgi:hypothetical protein
MRFDYQRVERDDERSIRSELDPVATTSDRGVEIVVKTIELDPDADGGAGTYPTTGRAVYACIRQDVVKKADEDAPPPPEGETAPPEPVPKEEGAEFDFADREDEIVFVCNLTEIVPPIGAEGLLATQIEGYLYMSYYGPPKPPPDPDA